LLELKKVYSQILQDFLICKPTVSLLLFLFMQNLKLRILGVCAKTCSRSSVTVL